MKRLIGKVLSEGKFWTDAWSLVDGCTPVSPGCAGCWLAGISSRNLPNYTGDLTTLGVFNGKVVCREDRLDVPLKKTKPRVFSIWSDLFHESVPREFILAAFSRIARAKHHHFIIITKRPQRAVEQLARNGFLFPNVTLLVTMEDQERVDLRAPYAKKLAALGWRVGILAEPLLGPIILPSLCDHAACNDYGSGACAPGPCKSRWASWLITGGESGHRARPARASWVRSLRDQAVMSGLPFMLKQWGEWLPDSQNQNMVQIPAPPDSHAIKVGKKKSGRLLDGREWLEVPEL